MKNLALHPAVYQLAERAMSWACEGCLPIPATVKQARFTSGSAFLGILPIIPES
jgi:hypothetical protein